MIEQCATLSIYVTAFFAKFTLAKAIQPAFSNPRLKPWVKATSLSSDFSQSNLLQSLLL